MLGQARVSMGHTHEQKLIISYGSVEALSTISGYLILLIINFICLIVTSNIVTIVTFFVVCSRLARKGTTIPDLGYCGMPLETLSRLLCHLQQFWVFFRSFLHKRNNNGQDFLSKDSNFLATRSVELKDMNSF